MKLVSIKSYYNKMPMAGNPLITTLKVEVGYAGDEVIITKDRIEDCILYLRMNINRPGEISLPVITEKEIQHREEGTKGIKQVVLIDDTGELGRSDIDEVH